MVDIQIERLVQGRAPAAGEIEIEIRGGEEERLRLRAAGGVAMDLGDRYLFMEFEDPSSTMSRWRRFRPLPGETTMPLPEESTLRRVWRRTCAASLGEIYPHEIGWWRLVVPAGIDAATMMTVFGSIDQLEPSKPAMDQP